MGITAFNKHRREQEKKNAGKKQGNKAPAKKQQEEKKNAGKGRNKRA